MLPLFPLFAWRPGSPTGGIAAAPACAPPPAVEPIPEARDVAVFTVFAAPSEMDVIGAFMSAACEEAGEGEIDPVEAVEARYALLAAMEELDTPVAFEFDSAWSNIPTSAGKTVGVCLVKGTDAELDEFTRKLEALGGRGTLMGVEDVVIGADAFAVFVRGVDRTEPEELNLAGPLPQPGADEKLRAAAKAALLRHEAEQRDRKIARLLRKKAIGNLKQKEVDDLVALCTARAICETVEKLTGSRHKPSPPADDLELVHSAGPLKQRAGTQKGTTAPNFSSDPSTWTKDEFQDPFFEQDVEQAEGFSLKHRSPSRERYKLRHKYGVREAQLLGCGFEPQGARFICRRVKELQAEGWWIVLAVEQANEEWLRRNGWDDEVENLRVRAGCGLTVPRLIDRGYTRDRARCIAWTVADFMMAGCDVATAQDWANKLCDALDTPSYPATAAKVRVALRKHLLDLFIHTLTNVSAAEVSSGALWVADVAVGLCWERFPATERLYRREEALEQARAEWSSMTPENRKLIRQVFHETRLRRLEDRLGSPHNYLNCDLCESTLQSNARICASSDEGMLFPPAPHLEKVAVREEVDLSRIEKAGLPRYEVPPVLVALLSALMQSPENLPVDVGL